jgi:hypothetical protein
VLRRQLSSSEARDEAPAEGGEGGSEEEFSLKGYLNKVLNARVYDVAIETPLQPALNLSNLLQNTVLLKVRAVYFVRMVCFAGVMP